jgi:hypothetical protein
MVEWYTYSPSRKKKGTLILFPDLWLQKVRLYIIVTSRSVCFAARLSWLTFGQSFLASGHKLFCSRNPWFLFLYYPCYSRVSRAMLLLLLHADSYPVVLHQIRVLVYWSLCSIHRKPFSLTEERLGSNKRIMASLFKMVLLLVPLIYCIDDIWKFI